METPPSAPRKFLLDPTSVPEVSQQPADQSNFLEQFNQLKAQNAALLQLLATQPAPPSAEARDADLTVQINKLARVFGQYPRLTAESWIRWNIVLDHNVNILEYPDMHAAA